VVPLLHHDVRDARPVVLLQQQARLSYRRQLQMQHLLAKRKKKTRLCDSFVKSSQNMTKSYHANENDTRTQKETSSNSFYTAKSNQNNNLNPSILQKFKLSVLILVLALPYSYLNLHLSLQSIFFP
jgi:hypothetical protein